MPIISINLSDEICKMVDKELENINDDNKSNFIKKCIVNYFIDKKINRIKYNVTQIILGILLVLEVLTLVLVI